MPEHATSKTDKFIKTMSVYIAYSEYTYVGNLSDDKDTCYSDKDV